MAETTFRGAAMAVALALGLSAGSLASGSLWAGTAQDRIFATGVLDPLPAGAEIVYDHRRALATDAPALQPIADGSVALALTDAGGGREARVTLLDPPRERRLNPFPAEAGNPLLMVFMETAVHSMATLSGGSPVYIRNRLREAVRTQDEGAPVALRYEGRAVEGERFTFRPFAADPNRARMGPFADLEIGFVISDDVPGSYAALSARTAAGADGRPHFAETMILRGVEFANHEEDPR